MRNFAYMRSKYGHYRSKTEIIAKILQAANGGSTKTKIMYVAFLSHVQLKRYLPLLIQDGLLEYLEATHTYRTTEKGLKFLKMHEQIKELMMTERNFLPKIQNK
jgi:predicted transcriptional regulator